MKNFLSTVPILSVLLMLFFSIGAYAQPVPQVGDYGSVTSGTWSNYATTFRLWDGTGWNTVPTSSPGGTNIFILPGTTVTYDSASTYNQNCQDLIVEANATFKSDEILPQDNGSLAVLKIEGDTIWVAGNLGGGPNDGLTIETKTSTSPYIITLCGSGGSVNLASVRPNSHQSNTPTFVFARNANINYAGLDGTGGVGIYSQRGKASSVTFTVNAGDTVNFAPNSDIAVNPTLGNNGNLTTTFNINGIVNLSSGNAFLEDTASATCTLNIGSTGILNIGKSLVPSLYGANVAAITVASGGALNILNGGTADFTDARSSVTGTGTFALKAGGSINIGAAAGLDATNGPIKTTTATFDTAANYNFVAAGAQSSGALLPATVNNYSVDSTSVDTLNSALKINGALLITGTLVNNGGIISNGTATVKGTYQHNLNGGVIPTATWATGSTCLITGTTTGDTNSATTGANQNFYNFVVNCPNLTQPGIPCHFDMASNTISGNLTFNNTNGKFYALTGYEVAGSPKTITVNGNFSLDSSSAYVAIDDYSSKHAVESIKLIVKGNTSIVGAFGLTVGSSPNLVNLIALGNLNLQAGSQFFSHSGTADSVIFAGTSVQNYIAGTLSNAAHVNYLVQSGSIVNMDTSAFQGGGSFTLNPGGTVEAANLLGLNGNIRMGTINLSKGANYLFNGTAAQVTGTLLPDSVANLTINNAAGVVLTQTTSINDTLFLTSGLFDNTIPFTEGSNFKLVIGNGSLKNPVTGVDNAKVLPLSFKVEQNYPNPFNPSTTINFSLKSEAVVTIKIYNILGKEVRTLVNEERPSGNYSIVWNGCDNSGYSVASGTYFYRYTAGDISQVKKMVLLK